MLNGRLTPFLDEDNAEGLSYALKIVINIVYGLTSAKFDNAFRDNRNVDNIVAKRGALFMINLKHEVQKRGHIVAHIKTDSIKIPDATPDIIDFVVDYGKQYGYDFEHECTYEKMCLVNDAVYVAYEDGMWTTVGAQFQHPYVFKTLFSGEDIDFEDLCEAKSVVQGVMYLDFNNTEELDISEMIHVGRTGSFIPVKQGGTLYRVKDDKRYAVTGTKGYSWIEQDMAANKDDLDQEVDMDYFEHLRADALKTIEKFGSYESFMSQEKHTV